MTSDKVLNIKLRRRATRLGIILHKSKNRKWSIDNYLGYMVVDVNANSIVARSKYELTLDDVEELLISDEAEKMERAKH